MTVFDSTIPHYPVYMILDHIESSYTTTLPSSYTTKTFEPKYAKQWVLLMLHTGLVKDIQEGMDYMEQTFLANLEETKQKMFLVVDEKDEVVGSCSLWTGKHFPQLPYRLHWLAVDENHQCKGIAKALVFRCLQLYQSYHLDKPLYLATQTNSYIAISFYLSIGFQPYTMQPINSTLTKQNYAIQQENAWRIIKECINK